MKMTAQLSRHSHRHKADAQPSNLAKVVYFAIGVVTAFWSMNTQAAATCSGGGISSTVSMPATISVPRDAAAGTNLTGWIMGPQQASAFRCNTSYTNSSGAGILYVGSGTDTGMRIADPGGTPGSARVYTTNIQGIGLAVSVRLYANSCGWTTWSKFIGADAIMYPYIASYSCNGDTQPDGGQIAFAYVKLNGPIQEGGYITSERTLTMVPQHKQNQLCGTWSPNYYQNGSTLVVSQTCSTPNVNVDMGKVQTKLFTGIGSKAALKPFNISLLNCPSGIKTVSYQIDPVTSILDSANSVVALVPSTATGVGLQLMNSYGTRLQLSQPIPFTSYSSSGGNFYIPLLAAYYQTGSAVTPGPANTFLQFTMTYQ